MGKKVISILLIVIWMVIIFNFSQDSGVESGGLTEEVIVKTVETLTDIKRDSNEMNKIVNTWVFPVRKCAHYFVYFVLAFLIMNTLYILGIRKKTLIITSIICVLYAISDEVHQLFIDGRTGKISDVLLDSSASLISAFLYHHFIILRSNYERKDN